MTEQPNRADPAETVECEACEGTGKIVEGARTTGRNQHSSCQTDCEDCDGLGRTPEEQHSQPTPQQEER